MTNNYKIYCLTNNITNEKYIGLTKQNIKRRLKNGKGYKLNTKINKAIQKYGWDNFSVKILEETKNKENADFLEKYYIKLYDTIHKGYNIATGGFSNYKQPMSKETKLKLKNIHKGKHYSKNTEFKKGIYIETSANKKVPVRCIELQIVFDSIIDAETKLNISHHIWDCIKGKRKSCGGYHWEIVKEAQL